MSACNTERDDGCEWYFGAPFKSKRAIAEAEAGAGGGLNVGDRVRFTDAVNAEGWWFKAGQTGVIELLQTTGHKYVVRVDRVDQGAYVNAKHIELISADADCSSNNGHRFKVDDRVTADGGYTFDPIEGAVVEVRDTGSCVVRSDTPHVDMCGKGEWFYFATELELLPTFPAGTRVKLKRHVHRYAAGDTGVVTVSNDENVGAEMDRGGHWAFRPQDFAVVPEPWLAGEWESAPDWSAINGEQAKPKFKAGDVVQSKRFPGATHTIAKVKTHYGEDSWYGGDIAYDYADTCGWDREQDIKLVTQSPANDPAQPCIVMRLDDGAPRPSYCPHVHPSAHEATKEAERLATINPGKQFEVYQRVTGRVAEQHIEMKVA